MKLTSTHNTVTCVNHCFKKSSSQRSLHNAPIFRLLLKVAVNGTHQCDFLNFCGGFGPQRHQAGLKWWSTGIQALHWRQKLTSACKCHTPVKQQKHYLHTFSAFWLWSSVVSVLISVTTDMSPTGDLLVTLIFDWGGVHLSLLSGPRVLHWHGT